MSVHYVQIVPGLLWALLPQYALTRLLNRLYFKLQLVLLCNFLFHLILATKALADNPGNLIPKPDNLTTLLLNRLINASQNLEKVLEQIHPLKVGYKIWELIRNSSNYVDQLIAAVSFFYYYYCESLDHLQD